MSGGGEGPVAVVGAGSIGVAFALVFARAGLRVRITDPDAARRAAAPGEAAARLRDLDAHGLLAEPPGVAEVRGTNLCRIHVHADPDSGRVFAFAVIDNLWKGAASQAVQNLNLMLSLPEGQGIS